MGWLDGPWYIRYFRWVFQVVFGEVGISRGISGISGRKWYFRLYTGSGELPGNGEGEIVNPACLFVVQQADEPRDAGDPKEAQPTKPKPYSPRLTFRSGATPFSCAIRTALVGTRGL